MQRPLRTLAAATVLAVSAATTAGASDNSVVTSTRSLLDSHAHPAVAPCLSFLSSGKLPARRKMKKLGYKPERKGQAYNYHMPLEKSQKARFGEEVTVIFNRKHDVCGFNLLYQANLDIGAEWMANQLNAQGFRLEPSSDERGFLFRKKDQAVRLEGVVRRNYTTLSLWRVQF